VCVLTFVITSFSYAQPPNDACSNALNLCPQKTFSINNIGATQTSYPFGEDDFNFCFAPKKTIWFKLEANNKGGAAFVKLSNLTFQTPTAQALNFALVKAQAPCDGTTYLKDTCIAGITTNTTISLDSLDSNTTYYLCLAGNDVNGIISEFSLDIQCGGKSLDRKQPTLSIYADSLVICEKQKISIAAFLTDCPNSGKYKWYKNGQLFAISDSSFIFTSSIQQGDIISVRNNCFTYCVDSLSASTLPFTVKHVDLILSNDTTITAGDRALLHCYSSVDSLFWEPSYLVQTGTSTTTYADPKETTTFYANATINGCLISKSIVVSVIEDLKIYNTFSPNGDDINETWVIDGIEKYPDAEVSIFTRWGQRVFFMLGYNRPKAWNGEQNGKKLAAGTYFYTIDLNDGSGKIFKGSINLIR
jgi:gliding motility-associated-like protein